MKTKLHVGVTIQLAFKTRDELDWVNSTFLLHRTSSDWKKGQRHKNWHLHVNLTPVISIQCLIPVSMDP